MTNQQAAAFHPLPPWLLTIDEAGADIYEAVQASCKSEGFVVRRLDGQNMTTLDGVFDEFGKIMGVPDYYGRNSAALEECLNDLSWLSAPGYLLVVANPSLLLGKEPPSELSWLLTLLKRVCQEWSRPVCLGEEWDRPAIPFHVVFCCESSGKTTLSSQIASLPKFAMKA